MRVRDVIADPQREQWVKKVWMALALCAASLVVSVADAAELTAAQIVDKNIAARGGLAAWRAVNAITLAGEMDAGGNDNVKLPFSLSLKRPQKYKLPAR